MCKVQIIKTNFLLPFKLPIKDEKSYVRENGYGQFKFKFFTHIEKYFPYEYNVGCFRSSVAIQYVAFVPFPDDYTYSHVQGFLYTTLDIINLIIRSIKSDYNLPYIYELTIHDLPNIININFIGNEINYSTNNNYAANETFYISNEDFIELSNKMSAYERDPQYSLETKFHENAKALYIKEQFCDAVISLETAFEIFIYSTIEKYLVSINSPSSVFTAIKQKPFSLAVTKYLSEYAGLDLGYRKTSTNGAPLANYNPKMGKWFEQLYSLRNDIVHEGKYEISGPEIWNALTVFEDTREYIISLFSSLEFEEIKKADLTRYNGIPPQGHKDQVEKYIKQRKIHYSIWNSIHMKLKNLLTVKKF